MRQRAAANVRIWAALLALGCQAGTIGATKADGSGAPRDTAEDSAPSGADTADSDTGDTDLPLPAGLLILDHARVVDARGEQVEQAVLIVGDTIFDVRAADGEWPEDATIYDIAGMTVTPGLVDAHVHLAYAGTIGLVGDTLDANLRNTLYHGVTQVVDVGGPTVLFAVRDANKGPHILASGPFLATPGSHPCENAPDPALCRFVDEEMAEAAANSLVSEGADVLKVAIADAGFTEWGPTPRMDANTVAAIVAAGAPVFAHVDENDDVVDAVAAGITVLAHPPFAGAISDAAIDAAVTVPVESTVGAFAGVGDLLAGRTDPYDPALLLTDETRADWADVQSHPTVLLDGWADASAEWAASARENLGALHAAGATILPGSDAGYYFVPHGSGLHRELAALVELGWTPLEALTAATLTSRQELGLEGGEIVPGARADLLVIQGDPLADIAALDDIQMLVLRGVVMPREDIRTMDLSGTDYCLSNADCANATCDALTHVCEESCSTPWIIDDNCGVAAWCMPEDAVDADQGVCHGETVCDLYAQDCAPAYYAQACIPYDGDTSACWYGGPQKVGQPCSTAAAATSCQPGLFCSTIASTCFQLCDPTGPKSCVGAQSCVRQFTPKGAPWFGLCL